MDLNEAIFSRRSVREYTSQTVDDQTIQKLIDAAAYAPNAMHQQPWTFTVVRDQKMLDEISRDAKSYMLDNMTPRPGRTNRGSAQRT
jgi:nitroreductase